MTREEASKVAKAIKETLPEEMRKRLKNIDVVTRLHDGMCTIRLYMYSRTAEDPKPYIFPSKEL